MSRGVYATPTYRLPKTLFSVEDKVTKVQERSSYQNIGYEGHQSLVAQKWSEGDLEFPIFDRSFGVILASLIGVPTTSAPASGVYTHTFVLQNDNQHPSMTIAVEEGGIVESAYRLSMIDKLEIKVVPDDMVTCKVSFLGKKSADWTVTMPARIEENKWLGRHLQFKIATLASGLAATTKIPLKSLTLRFEKRLKMDSVNGTVEPVDILNQAFSIEGDIELNLEDKTYKAFMLDGSYRAVRINLVGTTVIGSGTGTPEFLLDLSRVSFDGWESDEKNDEIATQKLTFKALYDVTNANIINSCTLKNTATSY
jgi:hypothetical protein